MRLKYSAKEYKNMAKKLKWKYNSKRKSWHSFNGAYISNDFNQIKITKCEVGKRKYRLEHGMSDISYFRKVSSAKKVAELIAYG